MRNKQRMLFVKNIKRIIHKDKLTTTRDMAWIAGQLDDEEKEWVIELGKFAEVPF